MIRVALTVVLLVTFSGCQSEDKTSQTVENKPIERVVKILDLNSTKRFKKWFDYPAEISPYRNSIMAFELSGKIVRFKYNVGDRVKKGSLIAQIDDSIYRSNLKSAKAKYKKSILDFDRYQKLYNNRTVSKSRFEQIEQTKDIAESNYRIAQKNIENTKLIAEFSGVIAKKYVDDFARVTAKERVVTLQDNSKYKVTFFVPESDMISAKGTDIDEISKLINLYVRVGTSKNIYEAELYDASTEAESTTRTYEITAVIDNPKDANILPGMSANIRIEVKGSKKRDLFIPSQAIFGDSANRSFVWVVDSKSRVKEREIKLGRFDSNSIEIKSGLRGDERVVLSGVKILKSGDLIKEYRELDR